MIDPTDNEIVDTSITGAYSDAQDALGDDDTDWLRTVIASLAGRSDNVKKALLKALLDGQSNGNPAGLTTFFHGWCTLGSS